MPGHHLGSALTMNSGLRARLRCHPRVTTVGRLLACSWIVLGGSAVSLRAQGTPSSITVSGTVYDSIARRRISGATVQLVGADNPTKSRPFSAVSDSSGRFSIGGVPAGRYLAGFFHAALDTLGLEISARVVHVGAGAQRVELATPSPRTVVRSVCPTTNTDSSGLFLGVVRKTEDEGPIARATVVVEWSEFILDGVQMYERPRQSRVEADQNGWFAFCGLPGDVELHARAMSGADSSGYVEVEVPPAALRHQTFLAGGASHVALPAEDTVLAPGRRVSARRTVVSGGARLTGTVVDPAGKPVANAHALLWGTDVDVQTSERGAFVLDSLPGGTHTLEIRVIGYIPVMRVVQLAASRPATIEVTLDKAAVILATETVRGKLVYSRGLAEFDRRRRSGFGRYMSPADIERRPNARLSSLLQGMLGVYVRGSSGSSTVMMRGDMSGDCTPSLYVDGNRGFSEDFDYLFSDEIAGIEVYSRESQRPAGYIDSNHCGAILVWTRPRHAKARKDESD